MSIGAEKMAEEIFDVVLQPTMRFQVSQLDWDKFPPLEPDLSLDSDFWIGRLPYSVTSESVIDAYSPAGFNFHPSRNPGYHYAFCRKVYPPNHDPEHLRWDHDGVICRPTRPVIKLSTDYLRRGMMVHHACCPEASLLRLPSLVPSRQSSWLPTTGLQ